MPLFWQFAFLLTLAGLWQETGAPGDPNSIFNVSSREPETGTLSDASHKLRANNGA